MFKNYYYIQTQMHYYNLMMVHLAYAIIVCRTRGIIHKAILISNQITLKTWNKIILNWVKMTSIIQWLHLISLRTNNSTRFRLHHSLQRCRLLIFWRILKTAWKGTINSKSERHNNQVWLLMLNRQISMTNINK